MEKIDFYLPSTDKKHMLHVISWQGDGPPLGVLQLVHGMVEFIDRYHEFAAFLCKNHIAVIGHDHLGHGLSVASEEELGFFHETDGRKLLIQDIHRVTKEIKKLYPHVPYFILGHSMGSFCVRKYLTLYGDAVAGAILLGTGNPPVGITRFGKELALLLEKKQGKHYRSAPLAKIAFANYLRHIKHPKTDKDWLSRDEQMVSNYVSHKHCSFLFTVSAYGDLFSIVAYACKKLHMDKIPRTLPLLIASGAMDPVGNWGKDPEQLYQTYLAEGFVNVERRIYPNCRHEILNEVNRREVYADITHWLLLQISRKKD